MRERAQHVAEFRVGRVTAAERLRHARREYPACSKFGEILRDEAVVGIVNNGPRRKAGAEFVHQPRPIRGRAGTKVWIGRHRAFSPFVRECSIGAGCGGWNQAAGRTTGKSWPTTL